MLLFLPINTSEAGGEFGSVRFMIGNALAALSVPRASLLCTRAFYVIMWTGHGYLNPNFFNRLLIEPVLRWKMIDRSLI